MNAIRTSRAALTARLRHPLAAQMARYAIAGVIVLLLGLGIVLLLSGPFGLGIQLAILCSYPFLLVTHFTLQRYFVFARESDYRLANAAQVRRYLLVIAGHYGCVAAGTALLVHLAGLGDQPAYAITVTVMPVLMFAVLRLGVFH